MSIGKITLTSYFVNLICLSISSSLYLTGGILEQIQANNKSYNTYNNHTILIQPNDSVVDNIDEKKQSKRVKRNPDGKLADSSKMPQKKLGLMFLQLFRNSVQDPYIGARHPMHPIVVKPAIMMFKEKILEFFFPPLVVEKDEK